jgi:lysophospholipase L1-like esterase
MTARLVLLNAGVLLVSLIVAGAAGEGIVRLKNSSMHTYDVEMWRYGKALKVRSDDPLIDHEQAKNASADLEAVTIRTNEWGLRGGPVPPPVPGQRRILFLGSSITLGWGVAEADTETERLARRFAADGERVIVMNGGVANYNTVRAVALFLHRLEDLKPTDIVVQFFLRDAEDLKPDASNWLLHNSELALLLWRAWHQRIDPHGEASDVDHYRAVFAPDAPGFVAAKAALKRLADYAAAHDIRLYMTMIPDIHNLRDYQLGFAHADMAKVAAEDGYRYLDLLPAFDRRPPEQLWAMPGDPHPNALGHQLMADAIYPFLALK